MRKNTTTLGRAATAVALCAATLVGCLFQQQAKAAIEQLQGGIITKIEDDDYEVLIKGTGNMLPTTVETGDFLLAVAQFPTFFNAPTNISYANFTPATSMVTGLSYTQVTSVAGAGTSAAAFTLGVAAPADWVAAGLPAPSGVGTILQVYDDPAGTHLPGTAGLTVAGAVSDVTDGTLTWEFGFAGVAGEFFTAATGDALGGTFDAADITNIDSLTTLANFDLTFGLDTLDGHDFLGFGMGLHDLQIFGGLGSGGAFPPGTFQIHTDTDAYLKSNVPEPTSVAVWTLIAAIGASCSYRRRTTCV